MGDKTNASNHLCSHHRLTTKPQKQKQRRVVGFFASDDHVSREAFTSVAEAMHEDYVLGITADDNLAKREGISVPGIAVYKSFDGEEEKNILKLLPCDSSQATRSISTFIKAAGTPLVAEFHPEVHRNYVDVSLVRSTFHD